MKVLLISSTLTFVPENYEDFICSLATCDEISHLVLVENRSWDYLLKAFILIISGAAPRLGLTLFKNFFSASTKRKIQVFQNNNKVIRFTKDLNNPEFVNWVKSEKFDLLLHSRTRTFFKNSLLSAPRLGCVNIHHGLLPDQRGLMCDFWSHLENQPFGFSLHQMTSKLDDGPVIKVQPVKTDKSNYLDSIKVGAQMEASVCREWIKTLGTHTTLHGFANEKTDGTQYRRNPGLLDFYKARWKGIKI